MQSQTVSRVELGARSVRQKNKNEQLKVVSSPEILSVVTEQFYALSNLTKKEIFFMVFTSKLNIWIGIVTT